ncbi:hypothetical protein ONZ45_g8127 [Pleurotus djamor]|nr:hypothetical protein ONZ45_g8127 [Pleurotus djamor]
MDEKAQDEVEPPAQSAQVSVSILESRRQTVLIDQKQQESFFKSLRQRINSAILRYTPTERLSFALDPATVHDVVENEASDSLQNQGKLALSNQACNAEFLSQEALLMNLQREVQSCHGGDNVSKRELSDRITSKLKSMHAYKEKQWKNQRKESTRLKSNTGKDSPVFVDCDRAETTDSKMHDIWDSPVLRNFKHHDGKKFFRKKGSQGRLAARQVSGFTAVTSTFFCTLCELMINNISNFDTSTWKARNFTEHLDVATQWRDANSTAERERLTQSTGIRWSELLRLPYWDPIQFTVIDTMHNLFLGLYQSHCREIWGMNIESRDGDATEDHHTPPHVPSAEDMASGRDFLRNRSLKQLEKCRKEVLYYLCQEQGINVNRVIHKKDRAKALLEQNPDADYMLQLQPPSASAMLASTSATEAHEPVVSNAVAIILRQLAANRAASTIMGGAKKGDLVAACEHLKLSTEGTKDMLCQRLKAHFEHSASAPSIDAGGRRSEGGDRKMVLGRTILSTTHSDMEHIQLPSWVTRAPSNFGSAGRGKLSADQWRTVCSINLPITLIRLWGVDSHPNEQLEDEQEQEHEHQRRERERAMLDNFMKLRAAVETANMLAIDTQHAIEYKEYIQSYVDGVKTLYPHFRIRPNFHLSLHIDEFLVRFGPVHSYRTFGAERYNYFLQNTNTNRKHGRHL